MAVYTCPGCRRRIRAVVPAGGDGSGEVFVRHNKNRHTNLRCDKSRTVVPSDLEPLKPLSRVPDDPTTQEQLSGVRATWDNGVCVYDCGVPIMRDDRIIPRGNNTWAHVRCYQEAHQ